MLFVHYPNVLLVKGEGFLDDRGVAYDERHCGG